MNCIILVDLRENNGKITCISDESGNIAIFESLDEIKQGVNNIPICKNYPYMILDIDNQEVIEVE